MKITRIVAFLLTLCMLSFAFVSCSKGDEENTGASVNTATEEGLEDKLGFTQTDYQGYEFTMLVSEEDSFEHFAPEINGSLVNDGVYNRNLSIQNFFNITIDVTTKSCSWENREDYVGTVKTAIMSGEKAYDIVVGANSVLATSFSSDFFKDVAAMEYIDFSKEYWVSNQYENLNINGKMYGLSGDMNLTLYANLFGIFFNSRIVSENSLDNLYELVENKQWTLEKMISMARDIGNDLGDSGIQLGSDDMLGIICHTSPSRGFCISSGVEIFQRDGNGTPYIQTSPSEKHIDVYTRVSNMLNEATNYKTPSVDECIDQFAAGKALFMPYMVKAIEDSRIKEVLEDISIVPYPLYDENQADYITLAGAHLAAFPSNISNEALSAQVATYMAYYGQSDLVGKYYETHIKTRLASVPEMQDMLDIMRDTASTPMSYMYSAQFSPLLVKFYEVSQANDYGSEFVSTYKSYSKLLQKHFEKNILPMYS